MDGNSIVKRRVAQLAYTNRSEQLLGTWSKLLTEETSQCNLIRLNPRTMDGWYIHAERFEWHVCIKGNVLVAVAELGAEPTGESYPQAIFVPKLVPHAIYNASDEEAWIMVLSSQVHRLGEDEFPLPTYTDDLNKLGILWDNYFGVEHAE